MTRPPPPGAPLASPHVLIVDDDAEIRDLLSGFLARHGFRVSGARAAAEMDRTLAAGPIDLVILDVMLPGEDGLSICRRLRATTALPIVMLTAIGDDTDRIVGLELGADDYVAKPFNPRELLARVKAVLRRSTSTDAAAATLRGPGPGPGPGPGKVAVGGGRSAPRALRFEGWRLDLARRALTAPDGALVQLSAGEYDLLVAFVEHPQRVLTRDQLLDLARGRAAVAFDRAIDVQVSRLRRKIEPDPQEPTLIKTVRGGGYLFTPTVVAE